MVNSNSLCFSCDDSFVGVAKKSLSELRQLYFKLKDKVFGNDRFGFAYDTETLEKILKEQFGTTMTLDSVTTPKYVHSM